MYPSAFEVLALLLLIGRLGLGICLLNYEHLASPTVRLIGFPFALGGYEFIDGRWRGGLVSRFFRFPNFKFQISNLQFTRPGCPGCTHWGQCFILRVPPLCAKLPQKLKPL